MTYYERGHHLILCSGTLGERIANNRVVNPEFMPLTNMLHALHAPGCGEAVTDPPMALDLCQVEDRMQGDHFPTP